MLKEKSVNPLAAQVATSTLHDDYGNKAVVRVVITTFLAKSDFETAATHL